VQETNPHDVLQGGTGTTIQPWFKLGKVIYPAEIDYQDSGKGEGKIQKDRDARLPRGSKKVNFEMDTRGSRKTAIQKASYVGCLSGLVRNRLKVLCVGVFGVGIFCFLYVGVIFFWGFCRVCMGGLGCWLVDFFWFLEGVGVCFVIVVCWKSS